MTGPDVAPEQAPAESTRQWRRTVLGLAVVLLLTLGVAAQVVLAGLDRTLEREDQSYGVQAVVADVSAYLRTAESAHRGWLATLEESFRPEFESAVTSLEVSLRELVRLTAEDAGQQQRLDVLRRSIADRIAFWRAQQARMADGAVGREEVAARTAEGQYLRTGIERQLRAVQASERDLLERRQRQVRQALGAARVMSSVAVLVSVVLALAALWALKRNVQGREVVEQELADTEDEVRALLDSVHDLTESSSASGRILHVNRAWLQTLGWTEAEVIGQPWESFVAPEHRGAARALFARLVTTQETVPVDTVLVRRDGGRVHVRGTSVMRYEAGLPVATRTLLRDVTRLRELERRRRELEDVVSHDFRTPLAEVRAALAQLASGRLGPVSEAAHRMATLALTDTDRLIDRTEQLLDAERVRLAPVSLVRRSADLGELAGAAEEMMRPFAVQSGVLVKVSVLPGTVLRCDPDSVLELLCTLMANAIAYSPAGAAVLVSAVQGSDHVHVRVVDHGPAIAADQLEGLFRRERQRDAPDPAQRGRAGLGLDVCQAIVEQHGGLAWAQSEGHGRTTIHVVLPTAPEAAPAAHDAGDGEQPARRILLIDAEPDVRGLARASLEMARGWDVYEAGSGEEGLEIASELRPDVIVVASTLRSMDAVATLYALRAHGETRDIPAILLAPEMPGLTENATLKRETTLRGTIMTPLEPLALADEISRIMAWDPELFPDWG